MRLLDLQDKHLSEMLNYKCMSVLNYEELFNNKLAIVDQNLSRN